MAAGNFQFYNSGKLNSLNGQIDADTDTLVMVLLAASYTPDAAAQSTYGDVSGDEITDPDYAPQVISGAGFSESAGVVTFDSDDVSFGGAVTIEAKYAAVVRRDGASLASGDLLLGYVDLNTSGGSATVSSTNDNFAVNTPNGYYDAS
jgi:hypothetical protein